MTSGTRQSLVSSLQKIVVGMDETITDKTVVLNGKVWKVVDLRAAFQAVLDLFNATTASQQAWHKGVVDEKAARVSIRPDMEAFRSYIAAAYGTNSAEYTKFGFVVRKQGKPSADTVATRVKKTLATREARNTMGKKQRLKIKGTLPTIIQPAVFNPSAIASIPAPVAPFPAPNASSSAAASSAPASSSAAVPAVGQPSSGNGQPH